MKTRSFVAAAAALLMAVPAVAEAKGPPPLEKYQQQVVARKAKKVSEDLVAPKIIPTVLDQAERRWKKWKRDHERHQAHLRRQKALAAAAEVSAAPVAASGPAPSSGGVWHALAQCESGGNWAENAGTIYDGGLQFHPDTWLGYGGGAYAPEAWMATPSQQIAIAVKVQASQGWGAWPSCAAQLGLI